MQRRQFLKVGGALGVGSLALEGCGRPDEKLIPLLVADEPMDPSFESWVSTFCQQCPAGCGINVRTMHGESLREVEGERKRVRVLQAKKIEGNPLHPLNQGRTCARGQAGLQVLYNPDRIQQPLRLNGPRGSGQYVPISWDEATEILTRRLRFLRETASPEGLFLLGESSTRGSMTALTERFARAFGTPYLISCDAFETEPLKQSLFQCTGQRTLPVYDIANCSLILSLGANILETYLSPVHYTLQYGRMRQGRPGYRGKFVQAAPRLSLTAANADEWLPIRPYTEGVLALSLASVLVRESLYDKEFVSGSTHGFAAWAENLVAYVPEKISAAVDLSAQAIIELARELFNRRPSLVTGDSQETTTLAAVHCLNALLGTYGRKGGVLKSPVIPEPVLPMNPTKRSPADRQSVHWRPIRDLVDLLNRVQPRESATLLVLETNPLFAAPHRQVLQAIFKKVPFIASFASFMDETSQTADLILPNHTYLERWDDSVPDPACSVAVRTLGQPVVMPRFNTRHSGDVLLDVAHRLGGDFAVAFPWSDFQSLIQEAFRPLHLLKGQGPGAGSFEDFWENTKTQGGWWDAKASEGYTFRTPSKKFEFAPSSFSFTAPEIPTEHSPFPYYLHLYPSMAFWDGRGANQPWLQEMPDPMTSVMWGAWVEINPSTAQRLSIKDGDLLRVESPMGGLTLPACQYPGLRPDVIAIPVGQGHQSYGRFASNRGANALDLLAAAPPVDSPESFSRLRVRIENTGKSHALARFGGAGSERNLNPHKR